MAIITLTTDWHNDDYYTGAVKGAISAHSPDARIIDISHQISQFNSNQAAFILLNSFPYFPDGAIHIMDVNSDAGEGQNYIAFSYKNHFFIGCNNGAFGILLGEDNADEIVELKPDANKHQPSFAGLSVFALAAAQLANTGSLKKLGEPTQIKKLTAFMPTINEAVIAGIVIYIDSYRNVITNITRELFDRIGKNRPFEILVQSYHYRIVKISSKYNEVPSGELVALFNSAGLLEIAINLGNVADLLNLGINSNIRIKFQG